MLHQSKFTINDETAYEGYTTSETWNGWECPMFSREVGEQIASDLNGAIVYDESLKAFVNPEDETVYESIPTEHGTLYAIGGHEWVWDEALA